MPEPLVVVGAGGFGRETLDVIDAINASAASAIWAVLGVADDSPSKVNVARLQDRAVPFLGPVASIPADSWVAVAVGAPTARRRLAHELLDRCAGFPTLVHPSAVVGTRLNAASGVVVCAHASIGTNVTLGRQVHLNPHAVVGHDVWLGDNVSVNPNATISGECVLEDEVLVGAGAVILQGVRVEAGALVGAAACVTRNVARGDVLAGVPARSLNKGESS